jgi:O-antigen/teichoic acid export membrane protein
MTDVDVEQHGPTAESDSVAPSSRPSSLRRSVGRVAAASGFSLIVTELITLVQVVSLARLLTPTEIGLFTAGTVLTAFLGDLVEGGLRAALVQRGEELEDAAETVFWAALGAGVLFTVAALAAAPLVGWTFGSATAGWIAAASSGSMLLFALTHVPEAMLQREFSVRRRMIVGPSVALTFAVVAVTLAACDFGVWSMVIGSYASSVVWVLCVWALGGWRPRRGRFSYRIWREMAKFGFPLLVGIVGLRIKTITDTVIVGRLLGTAPLGHFRYAQRIAQMPERGIIEVAAFALFPAFARLAGDADRMRQAYLMALRWTMIGAAPLTGLMIALGEPAVVIVLGEQWREAGQVVVAMAGIGIGRALCSVNYEAIKGAGKTSLVNRCTAIEVGIGTLLMVLLIETNGLVGAGVALSFTALLVGATLMVLGRRVVGVSAMAAFRAAAPAVPAAMVAGAVTFYVEHALVHADAHSTVVGVALLVADVAVFGATYLAGLACVVPAATRQAALAVLSRRGADTRSQTQARGTEGGNEE